MQKKMQRNNKTIRVRNAKINILEKISKYNIIHTMCCKKLNFYPKFAYLILKLPSFSYDRYKIMIKVEKNKF